MSIGEVLAASSEPPVHRPKPLYGLSASTIPAVLANRQPSIAAPLRAWDRSPGGGAEAPQVPEGRSGQSHWWRLVRRVSQLRPKPSSRRLRPPASAAILPASLVSRVTPLLLRSEKLRQSDVAASFRSRIGCKNPVCFSM